MSQGKDAMSSTAVSVSEAVQNNPAHSALILGVSDLLTQELGNETIRWDTRFDSRGRELLVLHATDAFEGEVEKEFAPDEFLEHYRDHLQRRFYDIKGALVRVGQWKKAVKKLYSEIESWSASLKPRPFCMQEPIVVKEQLSGPYSINRLVISYGSNSIVFRPVAAWIVAGQGRVDVDGPDGTAELILAEQNEWKLNTFDRRNPFVTFDQSEFERLVSCIISN